MTTLQQILAGVDEPQKIEMVPATTAGWLRRPELEKDGTGQVWEAPAGDLWQFADLPDGMTPMLNKPVRR